MWDARWNIFMSDLGFLLLHLVNMSRVYFLSWISDFYITSRIFYLASCIFPYSLKSAWIFQIHLALLFGIMDIKRNLEHYVYSSFLGKKLWTLLDPFWVNVHGYQRRVLYRYGYTRSSILEGSGKFGWCCATCFVQPYHWSLSGQNPEMPTSGDLKSVDFISDY